MYDALLYGPGDGMFFDAGSANEIGYLGDQLGIKLHRDDVALRLGLRAVLGARVEVSTKVARARKPASTAKKKSKRRPQRS